MLRQAQHDGFGGQSLKIRLVGLAPRRPFTKTNKGNRNTQLYISTSPLLTDVSFPSPAGLERGGFGNEAGVREKHGAFTPLKRGTQKRYVLQRVYVTI
jgi:hypothetical protein